MTLTKTDLVKSVMDKVRFKKRKRERQGYLFPEFDYEPLSKQRASKLVNATFEIIKKKLENGEQVLISRFGKFTVEFKWAGKGRNPRTGKQIIIESRRMVKFRASQKLKNKLNPK